MSTGVPRQESGSTSPRISDAAVVAAANALLDAGFVDPDDGTIPQWHEEDAPPWWTHPSEAVKVALSAALPHLAPSREEIADTLRQHHPRTGMVVASGVTCECGYWNGTESPGRDRPAGSQGRDGLDWHRSQVVLTLFSTTSTKGETQS